MKRFISTKKVLFAGMACLLFLPPALRATVIITNSVFQSTTSTGASVTCAQIPIGSYVPGILKGSTFTSRTDQIRQINQRIKRFAKGSSQHTTLKNKRKNIKLKLPSENSACVGGPGSGGPTGPAAPTPTPTRVPSGTGNFDAAGNVTAAGRALFKLPADLTCNKNTGRTLFDSTCKGCHGGDPREPTNKDYEFVSSRIPLSPMFITDIPAQDLCHIVAHLNRFRP